MASPIAVTSPRSTNPFRILQTDDNGHRKCSTAPWSVACFTTLSHARYRSDFSARVSAALTAARKLFCRERGVFPVHGSDGCVSVYGMSISAALHLRGGLAPDVGPPWHPAVLMPKTPRAHGAKHNHERPARRPINEADTMHVRGWKCTDPWSLKQAFDIRKRIDGASQSRAIHPRRSVTAAVLRVLSSRGRRGFRRRSRASSESVSFQLRQNAPSAGHVHCG